MGASFLFKENDHLSTGRIEMTGRCWVWAFAIILIASLANGEEAKIRALIIDGQNNHGDWPKTTAMMKKFMLDTGRFTVDVQRTKFTWKGEKHLPGYALTDQEYESVEKPRTDPGFTPDFAKYDVVVNNFGWNAAPWPEETKEGFDEFIKQGGGLVIIHAADNSFGDWDAYNRMIGVGGWGGRDKASGPYVYWQDGTIVRDTESDGNGGAHGPQSEFQVIVRDANHPITADMPRIWMHTKDELYDSLRGPALEMRVLATAYAKRSKRHEPIVMTIRYEDGRVFHTPMGHADYSMNCVGYVTTFLRGTEWAATGNVTIPVPENFPGPEKSISYE